MTTTTSPLKSELKARVLSTLADGAEGFACRIDAGRCRELLTQARGWTDEEWKAVATELRITR